MGDSVYPALGAGSVADVLLWRRRSASIALLLGSTALWFLFECAGYNLLSFIANVLLLLVVILFFWAKSATLLNRPLPPLPNLEISDDSIARAADVIRVWTNHALRIARDIAIGGNLKLALKVSGSLWFISWFGSFFNFLTLLYIGVLLSLSIPPLYDKYQHQIDEKLFVAHNVLRIQYQKVDHVVTGVLRKVPIPQNKEKKTQ